MPFDFDDEQMPTEAPAEPKVAKTTVVTAPPPAPKRERVREETQEDEEDIIFDKILYYRDVAKNPIFPDTDDPVAIEVEMEIQDFCSARARELMGRGQKKRGRRPAPITVFENKGRRATTRANEGRGGGLRDAARPISRPTGRGVQGPGGAPIPKGTEMTGNDVIQEIVDPNGFKMQRTYRQVLDKASGRHYYLCFVKGSMDNTEVGDGNKYELGSNMNGGQYFRVISEQTLPEGVASVKPMTLEAITAASEAHANATMNAIRNSKNNLLSAAIQTALKE